MKLKTIRIENFRSIKDQTISLTDYSVLVGPNGAGKSTVLSALNVFYRNTAAPFDVTCLTEEDFNCRETSEPIRISLTFHELSPDAEKDFGAYYRQGELTVSAEATWSEETESAEVLQYGQRLVMPDFKQYFEFDSEGAKASKLKATYKNLRAQYPDLPAETVKAKMAAALRQYEEAHPQLCSLEPSEDQFYGWSRGKMLLDKYVQWIYIPAVKDASAEQDEARKTALGELLARTVRSKVDFSEHLATLEHEARDKYADLISKQEDLLSDLSGRLEERLQRWAHPDARLSLSWHHDEKSVQINEPAARASVGEGLFEGELVRLGHGLQRAFIVSLLQEIAATSAESIPTLLLGFEEPELYQHPPQARYLAELLQELSDQGSQILLTTHSPYFLTAQKYDGVRKFSKKPRGATKVHALDPRIVAGKLEDALGDRQDLPGFLARVEQIMEPSLSEMFFCSVPILVEGDEDIAALATHLSITEQWTEFRRLGCHFVKCNGKTNLSRPIAICLALKVPFFVVFDADADKAKTEDRTKAEKDNRCILKLCGVNDAPPLPEEDFWGKQTVMWASNLSKVMREDVGQQTWDDARNEVVAEYNLRNVNEKNQILLAAIIQVLLKRGCCIQRLDKLSERILEHARSVQGSGSSPVLRNST